MSSKTINAGCLKNFGGYEKSKEKIKLQMYKEV